jgi:actin-related protein
MSAIQEKLKKMEVFFDQEEFVVIDNGTGFIKAGFSGQDLPRLIIPTIVGEKIEQVDQAMMQGNQTDQQEERKSYQYGNEAFKNKFTHTTY